jgi:methyltransferase (TIGR00027 family)
MEEGKASATAVISAMLRAAHLFMDGEPKILRDELASALSGANEISIRSITDEAVQRNGAKSGIERSQFWMRALRSIMVMRSRFVEDEVTSLAENGISQYVVLGAGLDSFALRRPDLAGLLRIFEVDHPQTQLWKRARIADLKLDLPPHLVFVPVDFEQQSLSEELSAAGYKVDAPGYFCWLGVTQYLTVQAIDSILEQVSKLAPRTEITFEYTLPDSLLDEEQKNYVAFCKSGAAERGEPWLSFFTPEEISNKLERLKFSRIMHLDLRQASARYFSNRSDQLRCPEAHRLVTALV